MKCFLIDDDQDDQDFFALALQQLPQATSLQTADNAIDALRMLADQGSQPDIIFLDINMPRMNGWECLLEIRKITSLDSVPVIMYSTSEYSSDKFHVSQQSFTEYLIKQSGVAPLAQKLSDLFQRLALNKTSN